MVTYQRGAVAVAQTEGGDGGAQAKGDAAEADSAEGKADTSHNTALLHLLGSLLTADDSGQSKDEAHLK